jgi:hypothetical protein
VARQASRLVAAAAAVLALLLLCYGSSAHAVIVWQGTSGVDLLDASASAESHQIFGNGGWDTLIGSPPAIRSTAEPATTR